MSDQQNAEKNTRSIVEIVLLENWLGHPKYSIMPMNKHKAQEMIDRGVAKVNAKDIIKPIDKPIDKSEKAKDSISSANQTGIQGETDPEFDIPVVKRVGRPPKNKMMSNYKNK